MSSPNRRTDHTSNRPSAYTVKIRPNEARSAASGDGPSPIHRDPWCPEKVRRTPPHLEAGTAQGVGAVYATSGSRPATLPLGSRHRSEDGWQLCKCVGGLLAGGRDLTGPVLSRSD